MENFHLLNNISLREWKYHSFPLKEVKIPLPLEMRAFHPVIFQYIYKKIIEYKKDCGNEKTCR